MTRAAFVLPLLLLGGGCARPQFECADNLQCNHGPEGVCEVEAARCAYRDTSCPASFRFGEFAAERAADCVEPLPSQTAVAWRQYAEVSIDGDPREFRRGRGIRVASDFGVSGTIWLSWDDDALYVAADVQDPNVESAAYEGQPLWHHDGVELLFDTDRDRASGRIPHADDFKFVVTALNRVGTSWGGIVPTEAWDLEVRSATVFDGTANQPSDQDRGYTVELALPWNDVLERPTVGEAWGLNLKIDDHTGPRARTVPWQVSGRFNYPSTAGTLVFADRVNVEVPEAPTTEVLAQPKYERVDLAGLVTSTTLPTEGDLALAHLFDGCVDRNGCSAGLEGEDSFAVVLDLGEPREIGFVRLYGDDRAALISTGWGVSTKLEPEDEEWTIEVGRADAHGRRWFTHDIRGTTARYVRLRVAGRDGTGTEAAEFELYALPAAGSG